MSLLLRPIKLSNIFVMQNSEQSTVQLPFLQYQKLSTLWWCPIPECGSNCITSCFFYWGCQYVGYPLQHANQCRITLFTRSKIIAAPVTSILGSSHIIDNNIAHKGGQYLDYTLLLLRSPLIVQDARPKIVDVSLTLISRMGHLAWHFSFT